MFSPRTHTRGLCVAWVPAAGACPCAVRAARLPANAEPEPKEQKKADFFSAKSSARVRGEPGVVPGSTRARDLREESHSSFELRNIDFR